MAAAILTSETVILHNLPYVRDINTMRRLLEDIGAHVLTPELRTHKISAANVELMAAPYELVKTIRASVLVLGRWSRGSARRACLCPEAAPSGPGQSTCICPRWLRWAPKFFSRP